MKLSSLLPIQALKFAAVGVLNTAVAGAVTFLTLKAWGWPSLAANGLGYVVGVVNSYFWNRTWTFSAGTSLGSLGPFLGTTAVCFVIQMTFLVVLKQGLAVPADLAQGTAIVMGAVAGFLLNRIIF
jgi:putative flippase GtrA